MATKKTSPKKKATKKKAAPKKPKAGLGKVTSHITLSAEVFVPNVKGFSYYGHGKWNIEVDGKTVNLGAPCGDSVDLTITGMEQLATGLLEAVAAVKALQAKAK